MAKTKFTFWKLLKYPPQLIYAIGLGPIYGRLVLMLTTTGRKSGKSRVTPLQYEEIDGDIYIGSARGTNADWWRNIVANPKVRIQVKSRKFEGRAELVTDLKRVADFLEYRIKQHPTMIKAIMRWEGLPKNHTRLDLENYATNRAIVIIKPIKEI